MPPTHLGDALGSVRQVVEANSVVINSVSDYITRYAYTLAISRQGQAGEWLDSSFLPFFGSGNWILEDTK